MRQVAFLASALLTIFLLAGDVRVSGQDREQFQGLSDEQIQLLKRRVVGTIRVQGVLDSADVVEIKSPIRGESTILSIVPDGAEVKQGDLLVQLDDTALNEQRIETLVEYETIRAQVQAQKAKLESLRKQAELETEVAQLKLQAAQLAQERYVDGELRAELDQMDRLLELRKRQYDGIKAAIQTPRGPNEQPRVSPLAVHEAQVEIERLETQKQLLTEYKSPHQKAVLELALAEAKAQLRRVQQATENEAREIEATLKGEEAKLNAVKQKLDPTDERIAACHLVAPRDGIAMHNTSSVRRATNAMQAGDTVQEQQVLLTLPNLEQLQLTVRINQTMIRRVRIDQPVTVRIDGFPNQLSTGRVTHIDSKPQRSSWPNTDRVEYAVLVELDDIPTHAKLGMTALAEIEVETDE